MDRHRVAIIIPAFNEEKTIFKVIKEAYKFGKVIVINDGSKDKTAKLAKKAGAIVKNHKTNKGYDAALNTGFKIAAKLKTNYIITFDADGQHKPNLIRKFVELLKSGESIVLGVRDKKNRLAEHLFSFYTNYKYNILDPLCGLKGYRLENYKLIGFFDNYKSIGVQLMIRNVSLGKSFKQVYFKVKEREGKPKFGNLIIANFKILRSLFFTFLKSI